MSAISTASSTVDQRVLVVGGGVSGLAACYFLNQRNIPCTLIEKSGRLGGLIHTDHLEGCDLEAGPDSFLATKTSVAALAAELGIADRIIGSNDAARRIYIRKNGKLIPMPVGMMMMTPGNLGAALCSPLFSTGTKVRFLTERWTAPRERTADVSVEQFVSDHFGKDILESLTEPLLSGVYGGDAGRLSAASVLPSFLEYERKYGSLMKGVRAAREKRPEGSLFQSFAGGMQTLTDAMEQAIRPNTEVRFENAKTLSQTDDGWRVDTENGSFEGPHVILACPAYACAQLLEDYSVLSANLQSIPYSSALLVTLVYDREALAHPLNGFGILVPRTEREHVAAATWISTKFPSRTPPDKAALRAFLVGDEATRLMNEPKAVLLNLVRKEFQSLMGVTAEPLFSTIHRWPDSMPQYVVGHAGICHSVERATDELPGLHICGNAYSGVGIPDCVRMARNVTAKINFNQNSAV